MRKEFLELGQIVGTHGVRGEVRVDPWCDSPDFAKRFPLLFYDDRGENPVRVLSCRAHGNLVLLRLEGVDTLDDAARMRGRILYIRRGDVALPEGTWFVGELLGCRVVDADDPARVYGTLTQVTPTGANDVWQITDAAGREYLIPAIKDVVVDARVEEDTVVIRPLKGIFDDAD